MEQFIAKHADKVEGTLSCFDRVLFRGYLPFFSGAARATFLDRRGVRRDTLKRFLLRQAYLVKDHAHRMADRHGRPFQYFGERVRKEELARQIVERTLLARQVRDLKEQPSFVFSASRLTDQQKAALFSGPK